MTELSAAVFTGDHLVDDSAWSPGSTIAYVVQEKKRIQIRISLETRFRIKTYFSDFAVYQTLHTECPI